MPTPIESLSRAARAAAEVLMRHWRHFPPHAAERKVGLGNLVTEADRAAEAVIRECLLADWPNATILGEEGGEIRGGVAETGAKTATGSPPRFIVDPLDGTHNFAQGLEHFAVSIAMEHDGDIVAGAILLPVFNDLYTAERGAGAFLNGSPIQVSPPRPLRESFLATGFACVRAQSDPDGVTNFATLAPQAGAIRRLGACTVDMAYVARGIFDAYFELGLSPWDVAAGGLIVREAGGRVSTLDGNDDAWRSGNSILASNGALHDTLLEILPVKTPGLPGSRLSSSRAA